MFVWMEIMGRFGGGNLGTIESIKMLDKILRQTQQLITSI